MRIRLYLVLGCIIAGFVQIAHADLEKGSDRRAENHGTVSLIHQEADRQGIPRDFAIQVAKRESGLRCNAYSKRDKTSGLYQLKPATARSIGFRGNTSELQSCNAGLVYGIKHLAICWRLANGNSARADACHRRGFRAIASRQDVERELRGADRL